MQRPTLDELNRMCQKPVHHRAGNWFARRVSRPLALRVTWLIVPWGIRAHAATLAAWLCGMLAAFAFAWGNVAGWLAGACLLQLWYLLDHVDGQLARFHGTASLDGVQLDYLMHHTLNLLVPLGIGYGLSLRSGQPPWLLAGLAWGLGLLLLTLVHDARYKAFFQRLKLLRGELRVMGGAGGRPTPAAPMPRRPLRAIVWLCRKLCETQVQMCLLTLLACAQWVLGDQQLWSGRICTAILAFVSLTLAVAVLARGMQRSSAEGEFAAWFRPAPDHDLVFEAGWWVVEATQDGSPGSAGKGTAGAPPGSS